MRDPEVQHRGPRDATQRATIAVHGATGTTGTLVIEALCARGAGARLLLSARSEARLRGLCARFGLDAATQSVVVDADEPVSVARMVERAGVVVACAGPFLAVGEPVVGACATQGVHYADSTGEAPFVRMVQTRYDATAREEGCALAPAMAFEVAVGDAAATHAARALADDAGSDIEFDLEIAYSITQGTASAGTRASGLLVLASGGLVYENGELREEALGAFAQRVPFRAPVGERWTLSFPSPEVVLVPLHARARSVRTLMRVPRANLLRTALRWTQPVTERAAPWLRRAIDRVSSSPPREALRATRFQLVATARGVDGARTRRVVVEGSDPYGLSSALLAEAALALASGTTAKPGARGLVAPSEVLAAEKILEMARATDGGAVTVLDF